MITVKNCKILNSLPNVMDGQKAYCEEEDKYFTYSKDKGWYLVLEEDLKTGITQYDLNKMAYQQKDPVSEAELKVLRSVILDYIHTSRGNYYMMLCKELSYYTVFVVDNQLTLNYIEDEIIACAHDLGDIMDIVPSNNAIEVWVRDDNNEVYCIMLFKYDQGIIKVRS